ncbi:MAG: hypothetical protein AAF594_16065, partial [Bacteroidota bacterium]
MASENRPDYTANLHDAPASGRFTPRPMLLPEDEPDAGDGAAHDATPAAPEAAPADDLISMPLGDLDAEATADADAIDEAALDELMPSDAAPAPAVVWPGEAAPEVEVAEDETAEDATPDSASEAEDAAVDETPDVETLDVEAPASEPDPLVGSITALIPPKTDVTPEADATPEVETAPEADETPDAEASPEVEATSEADEAQADADKADGTGAREIEGTLDVTLLGPEDFEADELKRVLRLMLTSRRLDEKMLMLL